MRVLEEIFVLVPLSVVFELKVIAVVLAVIVQAVAFTVSKVYELDEFIFTLPIPYIFVLT